MDDYEPCTCNDQSSEDNEWDRERYVGIERDEGIEVW
jgi:hypothetical protein